MTTSNLLQQYDGFIIDLWGVIHDGTRLYPGALTALKELHHAKKPVVFLSNAPRRAEAAQKRLYELGIEKYLFKKVITSGEVAAHLLNSKALNWGPNYYYLGPGKDENIIRDLRQFNVVASAKDADFVLNTGYEVDFQPHDAVIPTLEKLCALELPLLCVNPDLEVVKQDGTHMLCAGKLAATYEKMGGDVTYIGKPHQAVYEVATQALHPAKNLLAIGDNPLTDILGANHAKIDSLLIKGGVLSHHQPGITDEMAAQKCSDIGATPSHIAADLKEGLLAA